MRFSTRLLFVAVMAVIPVAGLACATTPSGGGGSHPVSTPPGTYRVSVASDGTQATSGQSEDPTISGDGRYIAFDSLASNLVPGDTNGYWDVFEYDTVTKQTTRVSVASDGSQADWNSQRPSISADGRYVAFDSQAFNLAPTGSIDLNRPLNVYVHDRVTGITTLVSHKIWVDLNNQIHLFSGGSAPSISADGRYVAFDADLSQIDELDANGYGDVAVADMNTGGVTRVSRAVGGGPSSGGANFASISANGRYIAFRSGSTNLVANNSDPGSTFVADRQTGTISSASADTSGAPPRVSISGDGRYIAFTSYASDVVPGDTNGQGDVFLRDRQTNTTSLVSVASDGGQTNGSSLDASISSDGRYIAFRSYATNLVTGGVNGPADVFVRDRQTGTTSRVSAAYDGGPTNGLSGLVGSGDGYAQTRLISDDGHSVVFDSLANNLVPGDTNGWLDVFLVRS